jgi:hypothetical protein
MKQINRLKFNEYPRPSIQTIKNVFGEDFYDYFKDWRLENQHDDIHEIYLTSKKIILCGTLVLNFVIYFATPMKMLKQF